MSEKEKKIHINSKNTKNKQRINILPKIYSNATHSVTANNRIEKIRKSFGYFEDNKNYIL